MKLWIFNPWSGRGYVGGALIAIAPTIERAKELLDEEDDRRARFHRKSNYLIFATDAEAVAHEHQPAGDWDLWVLYESFEMPGEVERCVLIDWHDG